MNETTPVTDSLVDQYDPLNQQYQVLLGTPQDVLISYLVILFSCMILFPITMLIINTVKRGRYR